MNNIEVKTNKNGWEDKTQILKEKIKDFIVNSQQKKYDHLTELHFSGMNTDVLTGVLSGSIEATKIEVFYKNNMPNQIHVFYDNAKSGQNIDVYISRKALLDLNIIN